MKNSLSLFRHESGQYNTDIHLVDGTHVWELHRKSLSETDILVKFVELKHYQRLPGEWEFTLPHDHKIFHEIDFNRAVQLTLRFIYDRDNPDEVDFFC